MAIAMMLFARDGGARDEDDVAYCEHLLGTTTGCLGYHRACVDRLELRTETGPDLTVRDRGD